MTFDQFLQYIFSGITSGSVYALTAIGFTLVFSATQIINFAQGQMVMLGGMIGVDPLRRGAAALGVLPVARWSSWPSSAWAWRRWPSGRF